MCVRGTGLAFLSAVFACHGTLNNQEMWVTTGVQKYTDIHDFGEWWDLRRAISVRRLDSEPGTRIRTIHLRKFLFLVNAGLFTSHPDASFILYLVRYVRERLLYRMADIDKYLIWA